MHKYASPLMKINIDTEWCWSRLYSRTTGAPTEPPNRGNSGPGESNEQPYNNKRWATATQCVWRCMLIQDWPNHWGASDQGHQLTNLETQHTCFVSPIIRHVFIPPYIQQYNLKYVFKWCRMLRGTHLYFAPPHSHPLQCNGLQLQCTGPYT